jgi:hypothetical protein
VALALLNKQIHLHFVSRKENEAHCMRLSGHDVSGSSPHFRSVLVFEMRSELKCCVLFTVGSLPRAENDGYARTLSAFLRHYSLQVPEVVGERVSDFEGEETRGS